MHVRGRHHAGLPVKRPFAAAFAGAVAVGCSVNEVNFEHVTYPLEEASEIRTCSGAFAKVDVDELDACADEKGTKGHCYDEKKVPFPFVKASCAAGKVCVADKVLRSAGKPLKACKAFGQTDPGACASRLIGGKMGGIQANADALGRHGCAEDEACAPCVDPTAGGADSGLCGDVGVYEDDCKGGTAEASETCCHSAGVCMARDGVPPDQRDNMSPDTCSGEGQVCAPAAMANGKPQKCSALGLSGVCLDVCFAKMLQGAQQVLRGGCRPTEVCLPCLIGSGQGMPGCD